MFRERACILNVNDTPAALYLTTLMLKRAGYEVLEANTGGQALKLARDRLPDLILLDVRLPDLSGHQVCVHLKADPRTSEIVVLQTSACDIDGSARTAGLEAGADGYLAQPYEDEELLAWVNALLRARRNLAASNDRLERLQQVTAALSDAVTPEDVTSVILQQGLDALQAAAGGVALRSEDGQHVDLMSTRGYPESSIRAFRRQPAVAPTPICVAIARDEPIYLESAEAERTFPMVSLKTVGGSRVALPFSTSTGLRGCLALSFTEWRTFDQHDRAFMMALARQCGQALDRARLYAEAKALARSREDLLAIVAHDLRNPLTTLTTAASLMRKTGPILEDAKFETRLGSIERSARQMNHLIHDLLDLARFQAGTLVLDQGQHVARELLQEVYDSYTLQAAQRSLRLSMDWGNPETLVRCDRNRVLQVFSNLVGNALKFTPEGGQIVLTVSQAADAVVFSVRDNGPGIPSEHLPRLFQRYFQVDPANRNGMGLGLSIAKAIVDAHGGTLEVRSEPGRGTVFTFALPTKPAATA